MIDYKIKCNLYDIFNSNPNVWKDLINNLNEQSKEVLINEIIKHNEGDIIKRVSNKISKNNVCHKMAEKVVKESYNQVNEQLQDYLKSESMNEKIEKSVDEYFNYRNYLSIRCGDYINKHVINLNDRLNNITKSIKELKLQYVNNESVESVENVESEENESESKKENDYNECFIKHGKKFNLKLNELMKFSKYNDVKMFKAELIKKNIIKKDFDLQGSTYRLTEEQKNQFVKDFNKFK